MVFHEERGLAKCGLACVLCSAEACPGCQNQGCANSDKCTIYHCASGRGLAGCYLCDQFPCAEKAFQHPRVRAFNRYAKAHGAEKLIARLRANFNAGITYHRGEGLIGDYDSLSDEEQIISLIEYGRAMNPYDCCPVFETEHFALRLVRESDAEDLLLCYSDPVVQHLVNADNCTGDFKFSSAAEVLRCIRAWLQEYEGHGFVRWAVIDRQCGRAIGTIEMFGTSERWGVLRVDVASGYERTALLDELFGLAKRHFFRLFQVERMLTKAVPKATERIATLAANGFIPTEIARREHYYVCA